MKLDQVIERHVNAMGGYVALEGLNSLQIEFHIMEPTYEADGIYVAERKGRMRVDIFMNGARVFTESYNGSLGWQWLQNAEHGSLASPEGSIALLRGIENQLLGLHEFKSRGHQLELVGQESVDNIEYFVIKLVYKDGHTLWRYINPTNWLIERSRERKALHVDLDPTETIIETRFTDFRQVGGLRRAFHEIQVDLSTGQLLQTTFTKQMLINPSLDPSLFEMP